MMRAVAVLVFLVVGCGWEDLSGRLAISGKVTYNGKPVDEGSISFEPKDPSQPTATAPIVGGAYQVPLNLGPAAGEHRVRVYGVRMVKDPSPYVPSYVAEEQANDPNAGMIPQYYLPKKYNDRSQLAITIDESKSEYDFDLKK